MPPAHGGAAQAIASVPVRSFQGIVWRTHWRELGATDASLSIRTSGRYHRGSDLFPAEQTWSALYTSLAPAIAIWELVRRSAARNLAYLRNNVLSELAVELSRVLDLSDPAAVGLAQTDLTGLDYTACQELAAAALAKGCAGLLVPPAALQGTNLVIFPRNVPVSASVRLVRSTELPLDQFPNV